LNRAPPPWLRRANNEGSRRHFSGQLDDAELDEVAAFGAELESFAQSE